MTSKEELFDEMKEQRDQFSSLVDKALGQRDEYKKLRDDLRKLLEEAIALANDYREQRESFEEELEIVEGKYLTEARNYANLRVEYEDLKQDSWSAWEVGLLVTAVGIVAIAAGAGTTALVYELK